MRVAYSLRRTCGRARLLPITLVVSLLVGLGWLSAASAAVGDPKEYQGPLYAASRPPTADKPQSKLWFHDGAWWASMVGEGGTSVFVHELMPDHTWRNTGALIDTRNDSTGDALWSVRDSRLYVASRARDSKLQVSGLTYDSATRSWSMAPGFPVTVESGGGSESATIDQDSLGNLWATYTRASRVWVAHSTDASRRTWTAGFQPNVPDPVVEKDDISALITFGSSIGLMWSDQESDVFRFAVRDVGASDGDPWQVEDALVGTSAADDHINLTQLPGDPQGRVFAAVKTTAEEGTDQNAPLIGVLVRTPRANGAPAQWDFTTAGTVAQGWTRPTLMIDDTNDDLYLFVTSSSSKGGGDILYLRSDLSSHAAEGLSFSLARKFLATVQPVNDVTGAKGAVNGKTGLVVLATSRVSKRYVHAEMALVPGGKFDEGGADTAVSFPRTSPEADASGVVMGDDVTAVLLVLGPLLLLLLVPLVSRLRR
jgi:hypothetical protein